MKTTNVLLFGFPLLAGAVIALLALTPEAAPLLAGAESCTHSENRAAPAAAAILNASARPTGNASPRNLSDPVRPQAGSVFSTPNVPRDDLRASPARSAIPARALRSETAAGTKGVPVLHAAPGDAGAFEVDPGVPIPASLGSVDPAAGLSEKQADLNRQIAAEFVQAVESSPDVSAAWKAEQARADGRFRKLFGDDLYRAQSLKGTREARGVSKP